MKPVWVVRFISVVLLAVGFQLLLKPVRMAIVHNALIPTSQWRQPDDTVFRIVKSESVGFYVMNTTLVEQKSSQWFTYTGFGNLYFLIGGVILLLLGRSWKDVALLFALHAVLSLISGVFLILGLWANSIYWIYAMDFSVTKAVPAATGMFVLMQRKGR